MELHGLNPCACSNHSLSRVTFSTASELLNYPGSSFRNERWGAFNTVFINSQSYCELRCLLASNSSMPYSLSTQPRIWVSIPLNSCSTPTTRMQILSLKRCWSHCWNESHHRENLYRCALSPSVRWLVVHLWLQTHEVFLFSQARGEHALNKTKDLI